MVYYHGWWSLLLAIQITGKFYSLINTGKWQRSAPLGDRRAEGKRKAGCSRASLRLQQYVLSCASPAGTREGELNGAGTLRTQWITHEMPPPKWQIHRARYQEPSRTRLRKGNRIFNACFASHVEWLPAVWQLLPSGRLWWALRVGLLYSLVLLLCALSSFINFKQNGGM